MRRRLSGGLSRMQMWGFQTQGRQLRQRRLKRRALHKFQMFSDSNLPVCESLCFRACFKESTSNSPFAAAVVLPKAKLGGFAPGWVPADPGNAAELELKGFAAGPDALPNAPATLPPKAPAVQMNVHY